MSTFLSLNHHMELPDDVFRLLRDSIYKRTGMWFADSAKYLLQKRLSPRARELNFDSFQKYFYFLQYDPRSDAEFDQTMRERFGVTPSIAFEDGVRRLHHFLMQKKNGASQPA